MGCGTQPNLRRFNSVGEAGGFSLLDIKTLGQVATGLLAFRSIVANLNLPLALPNSSVLSESSTEMPAARQRKFTASMQACLNF